MNATLLNILGSIAAFTCGSWIGAGICLRCFGPPSPVFHELRPFYLPVVAVEFLTAAAHDHNLFDVENLVRLGVCLAAWFYFKDAGGGDDRWRRRLETATGVVTRFGNRLTVTPHGART